MTYNNDNDDSNAQSEQLGDDDETVVERLHEDFIRLLREREADKGNP